MLKEISPVYQTFTNAAMSGTAVIVSSISAIQYKDSISFQMQWTGTPSGSFAVQGSLDYNPGNPQTGGPANTGTWTSVNALDVNGNAPNALGAAGQILFNMNQLAFPWVRMQYTNISGTGTLNGYFMAKSLG